MHPSIDIMHASTPPPAGPELAQSTPPASPPRPRRRVRRRWSTVRPRLRHRRAWRRRVVDQNGETRLTWATVTRKASSPATTRALRACTSES